MQEVRVSREQAYGNEPGLSIVSGFSTPLRSGTTAVAEKCPQRGPNPWKFVKVTLLEKKVFADIIKLRILKRFIYF